MCIEVVAGQYVVCAVSVVGFTSAFRGTVTREAICENTGSRTLEEIYSDQLSDGMLEYRFSVAGVDGGVEITSVSCYQSGSGSSLNGLEAEGSVRLLLEEGTTGENTFTVRAKDGAGTDYRFTFTVPYKPRGARILQIQVDGLQDGQTVTTGSSLNFRVTAYRPEADGNVYIPAQGTDCGIRVSFNFLPVEAGSLSDYMVIPPDPVVGDTNEHILYIYAEDSFGNWGERTLMLNGQRAQEGQIIGTAYIYVDMTVLGLGIQGPVEYDVLSDEPVSYVVLKSVLGRDMGEIYGSARENFGWQGRYDGNPEPNRGFYLKSLYTGYGATALEEPSWPRKEDNSIDLDAIDAYFGADVDMATLWRCIARNGIAKSGPDPDGGFGQFDYTGSSGWMYTVNGIFPAVGMDTYNLKDGDSLTLLYSLAGGWEVGGAGSAETNQVGYCIQVVNGSFVTNHIWDGDQCVCCGRILSCLHENRSCIDLQNGQHAERCEDCGEDLGSPAYHSWTAAEGNLTDHGCQACGARDAHFWQEKQIIREGSCTEAGEILYACEECLTEKTEHPVAGHRYGNAWEHDAGGHFKKCQTCGQEGDRMSFRFYWDEGEEDYICQCGNQCEILHDFTLHGWNGFSGQVEEELSDCTVEVQLCLDCGNYLYRPGSYEERHRYAEGVCSVCYAADPGYHAHSYGEPVKVTEPGCEEPGWAEQYCSGENCEEPVLTSQIPALGHSWGGWYEVSAPTCTEEGLMQRACSVCGAWEDQAAGYAGHTYENGSCIHCSEPDPDWEEPELSLFSRFRRRYSESINEEERI